MPFLQHDLDRIGRDIGQLITRKARQVGDDADETMRSQIGEMRSDIIEGWPVDTGASRAGWQGPIKRGEAHYELRNEYPYANTIERGGYRGVGPKTARIGAFLLPGGIQVGGGIFPTQRFAAPVRRALSKRIVEVGRELAEILKR